MSTTMIDEVETTARTYCQGLLVRYVDQGAAFVAALDETQRDLLLGFLMEAYCEGGLATLRELDALAEKAA